MRILFLSQIIPYPANAGPKIRVYHVLQYLAAAGHDVTLVAFRRESDTVDSIAHLEQYCSHVHTVLMQRSKFLDARHLASSLLRGLPFLIMRDQKTEMYELVRKLVGERPFDAVHADQLWMAQYARAAREANGADKAMKLVLDQHNAMYLIPQRLAADPSNPVKRAILNLEADHLADYEVTTCGQFDHVTWVSREDLRAVYGEDGPSGSHPNGQGPTHTVIPICVDPQTKTPIERSADARRVTFLGGLHWPPNAEGITWFWREVWPLVRERAPEAVLTIIGKSPPPIIAREAQFDPGVAVTGYVDDPLPYLRETGVFIVPLSAGGGMRVKIVDAWSWGLPVVSTHIGAEGIQFRDGSNLLIADDPADFAGAVVRLLEQRDLAAKLADGGRKTVLTHYDWQTVYRAWDEIYGTPSP
jgi:glycosyltransferase involved in cell wall biosynthesis